MTSPVELTAEEARVVAAALPDRPLRRQPYAHEVAAAVDFAALDVTYQEAADELDALFLQEWLGEQVAALADAITYTRRNTVRTRITAADMARLRAPVVGVDALADALYAVAAEGVAEARAELDAQGREVPEPDEDTLRELVQDHAEAVAQMLADGLSIAASRRAVQGARSGMTSAELAADVADYLEGLEHRWERDQLAGAVQQAQNAGRLEVFAEVDATASLYASELLDAATCAECRGIDGTEYATLADARRDYPSGGFRNCRGGPRCRGTVVIVLEGETESGSTTTV